MKQQQQQKIEITINDYKTMCGVIDIASTRGAFRANELAGIGILHNRLIEYIRQNEQQVNGPTVSNAPNIPNTPNIPRVKKNEK